MDALPSSSQNLQFFPSAIHSFVWFTVHRKGLFGLSPSKVTVTGVEELSSKMSPEILLWGWWWCRKHVMCLNIARLQWASLRAQGVLYTVYKRCPQWATRATTKKNSHADWEGGTFPTHPRPSTAVTQCPLHYAPGRRSESSRGSPHRCRTHTQLEQNHHRVKNNILFKHSPSSCLSTCTPQQNLEGWASQDVTHEMVFLHFNEYVIYAVTSVCHHSDSCAPVPR